MIPLFLFACGIIAIVFRMVLPPLPVVVPSSPQLLALVVIYGTLKLPGPHALFLSAALGLAADLLSPQFIGSSMLSLSLLSGFILLQKEALELRHWSLQIFAALVGTFLFMIVEYLLYSFQNHRWLWPFSLWTKIVFDSIATTLLAFILYPMGDWLLGTWEHRHRRA